MPSDLNLGVVFAAVRLKNEFTPEMQKVVAAAAKAGQEMQAAGRVLTLGITAPLVAAAAAAIKTSIDFESSFAGVRKTVTATEPELQALSDGFRALALEIPANVNELNKIGEAAGQLGIQTPNILGFTETMAALGVTTNLSSEAAATSLARLANITGLSQDEFDNLGSAIVGLGNNFATTESEIVDFGLRIAGAGELAGLSEGEILGIGTAMSSIGVQAEAGGTAVQKVLNEINQSVATGDEELRVFAEVAGMTAEQFSAAFRDDAAGAFESFVTGLGTQGDKSFTVMEDLGLESERVIRAFLGLANSGDLLSRAMDEGNKSFEENIALMIEAEQRYGTTESRLALLWARVRELGITLGDTLVPAVHSFINVAGPMLTFATDAVKWWSKWPGPLKVASLAVVALVAAVGPALLISGALLSSWATLAAVFPVLAAKIGAAALAAQGFWVSLAGPIAWVIAGIVALGGAMYHFREELGLVPAVVDDLGVAMENAREKVKHLEFAVAEARFAPHGQLKKAREELALLEAAAEKAAAAVNRVTITFPKFAVTLEDAKAQLAQAKEGLNQMATAGMVVDAEMESWIDRLEDHVAALGNTNVALEAVEEGIDSLVDKWTGAKFDVDEFNAAFGRLTDEQRANTTIMGEVAREYEAARLKIGAFNDELEQLLQAERRATDEASLLVDASDFLANSFRKSAADAKDLQDHLERVADEEALLVDASDFLANSFKELSGDVEGVNTSAGDLDVTLSALAGGMGGATGQGINLARSMMQVNDELEAGESGFSDNQIAAAVLGGVLGDLAGKFDGVAGQALQAGANIANAFATGGPIAGAIAATIEAVKALGSVIDHMVNGAQMRFNEFTTSLTGMLGQIASGALTAVEAWDKATNWKGNEEGFEQLRATQQLWEDAGRSAEEATNWAGRFAEANKNQDASALKALLEEYENIAKEAKAFAEWSSQVDDVVSSYRSLEAAAEDAFETAKQAALDAGNTLEEATAAGVAARQEAFEAGVALRIEEMAMEAAFQAALLEIKKGNLEGARAAARAAYDETKKMATQAFDAVAQAASAASEAEQAATADTASSAQDAYDGIVHSAEEAQGKIVEAATTARDEEIAELERLLESSEFHFEAIRELAETEAENINRALADIEDVDVDINYHYKSSGKKPPGGDGGYQPNSGDHDYSFASGSGGRYIDFGRESTIQVHGKERIVTEAEGRREAENNAASLRGVEDRLDRLDMNLQRAIKRISTDVTNVVMTKSL